MRAVLSCLAPALVLTLGLAAPGALALELGEKPPDLDVSEWIQGEPVVLEQCVGKKVVVVDIWASYEERCKKSIARLSRLALKHKDALAIVGVSDEKPEDIRKFAQDGKFKYPVACDGLGNTKAPYTKGIREKLPFAVVVDKTGVVVWQGNPLAGIERIVDAVLAGKFDAAKAKAIAELQQKLEDSISFHNESDVSADADKLLEADPANERGLAAKLKTLEKAKDGAGTKSFVEKILPRIDDDPHALNYVAWHLATASDFSLRHPAAALRAARRAVELTQATDDALLDTLARAQFECGMLDQAIETQRKAAAVEGAPEVIKTTLAYYLACAEARKAAK